MCVLLVKGGNPVNRHRRGDTCSREKENTAKGAAAPERAPEGQPVSVMEIAEQNHISKKFLDGIMAELRNAGLVHARYGREGGFTLARPQKTSWSVMLSGFLMVLCLPSHVRVKPTIRNVTTVRTRTRASKAGDARCAQCDRDNPRQSVVGQDEEDGRYRSDLNAPKNR